MKGLIAVSILAVVLLCSGCAGITGAVTGAFTGAVDAPAETYRHNTEAFEKYPILFAPDVLLMGPAGIITGPLFGLSKGVALDVQCMMGDMKYGEVFGSYGETSIWRPYTLNWGPVTKEGDK